MYGASSDGELSEMGEDNARALAFVLVKDATALEASIRCERLNKKHIKKKLDELEVQVKLIRLELEL